MLHGNVEDFLVAGLSPVLPHLKPKPCPRLGPEFHGGG
jgi:hypothetical protein